MESFKEFLSEDSHAALSNRLHRSTLGKISPKTYVDLMHYTSTSGGKPVSSRINHALVHGEDMRQSDKDAHHAILQHAKAPGEEVHLFSGVGTDPRTRTHNGIFHAKAHLSASHDSTVAMDFAKHERVKKGADNHVMHVHVHPTGKILHVSKISKHPMEHESIVPAGSKLKYHGTSDHNDGESDYKVHHYSLE